MKNGRLSTACGRPATETQVRLLPDTRSLFQNAYQSGNELQQTPTKVFTFVMDEEKLIIWVQERECLYSLFKDNCWNDIAVEVHAKGKEQAARYVFHKNTVAMRLCDTTT
jgi:hypothetical protein